MRLIDPFPLLTDLIEMLYNDDFPSMVLTKAGQQLWNAAIEIAASKVKEQPIIDAEPVRHEGTTTFIDTDDIDKYKSRIILTENKKSKFCRVFYEDDREHGMWVNPHMNKYGHPCHHCSECGFLASQKDRNYCPNCGAKMDAKEEPT